jgi:hypothetical protein
LREIGHTAQPIAKDLPNPDVGQAFQTAFQTAGSQDFPVLCSWVGDWKVALTGLLESLPYEDAKGVLGRGSR